MFAQILSSRPQARFPRTAFRLTLTLRRNSVFDDPIALLYIASGRLSALKLYVRGLQGGLGGKPPNGGISGGTPPEAAWGVQGGSTPRGAGPLIGDGIK